MKWSPTAYGYLTGSERAKNMGDDEDDRIFGIVNNNMSQLSRVGFKRHSNDVAEDRASMVCAR